MESLPSELITAELFTRLRLRDILSFCGSNRALLRLCNVPVVRKYFDRLSYQQRQKDLLAWANNQVMPELLLAFLPDSILLFDSSTLFLMALYLLEQGRAPINAGRPAHTGPYSDLYLRIVELKNAIVSLDVQRLVQLQFPWHIIERLPPTELARQYTEGTLVRLLSDNEIVAFVNKVESLTSFSYTEGMMKSLQLIRLFLLSLIRQGRYEPLRAIVRLASDDRIPLLLKDLRLMINTELTDDQYLRVKKVAKRLTTGFILPRTVPVTTVRQFKQVVASLQQPSHLETYFHYSYIHRYLSPTQVVPIMREVFDKWPAHRDTIIARIATIVWTDGYEAWMREWGRLSTLDSPVLM